MTKPRTSAQPRKRAALTHADERGNARMVDVSDKKSTARTAVARARIRLGDAYEAVEGNALAKGDVLAIARLAGIAGAKETSRLLPLCHPLPLSVVRVDLELDAAARALVITCTARTTGPTGVEMEALTGACVAALAAYDTCKSVTKDLTIEEVVLLSKDGGKSGPYRRPGAPTARLEASRASRRDPGGPRRAGRSTGRTA